MKYLIITLLLICQNAYSEIRSLSIPHELESVSVDYSDISKTGIIRVIGCFKCSLKSYPFNDSIYIIKNGETATLKNFLKEYWKIKYPTIFLDRESNNIIQISY